MKPVQSLLLLLSFSATALSAQFPAPPAPSSRSCGPSDDTLHPEAKKGNHQLPSTAGSQGLLVIIQVYRQAVHPNCYVVNRVAVDGQWVGANCSKSFFAVPINAGEHHVCFDRQTKLIFHDKAETVRNVSISPTQAYYFKVVGDVQSSAETALEVGQISPEEAQSLMAHVDEAHLKR